MADTLVEKFKFGPLVYNCVNEDDEEGNYYWPGNPPVDYDQWGIPVDAHGKQCLGLDCPFHPFHIFEDSETLDIVKNFKIPKSFKVYYDWCEENFLVVTKNHIITDILQKFAKFAPQGASKAQVSFLVQKLHEME